MSSPASQKKAATTVPQPKQIKFVSTDGLPQTKRRRVTAACRTCRKRKTKCSGEQPVCQTCHDSGHECLGYNEPFTSAPTASSRSHLQLNDGDALEREPKESTSPETTGYSNIGDDQDTPQNKPFFQDGPQRASRRPDSAGFEASDISHSPFISDDRTHVPYFRYFGPTAIVPGLKQMVVRVREKRKSNPSASTDSGSSGFSPDLSKRVGVLRSIAESQPSHSIQFYDTEDNRPNSELVTHLCEIFFAHVGGCFPCFRRDRFLRELSEKKLEPILVDAVCAVAARYSLHPLLRTEAGKKTKFPRHGDIFAHRAMCAVVDALACPTLAVVQACLLLAWEEFGSNRDSGLWMYLGISIRMAQDLGMQKLEGMKYRYGRVGLTPKNVRSGQAGEYDESELSNYPQDNERELNNEERVKEQERVDTFWSIFFLDRVISSGTGRPVTLRDDDIEISFPLRSESTLSNGWPAPFPPLIRVIHLYGRITDMLNSIKEVKHVTPEKLRVLAGMESDLTSIYQRLSPKLHFNAVNFQNYVKAGEGPNFLLLHFWFHTLIVLLHQPTLLHSFGGRIQQLFPNSRELSMSSAKTITDILAFAELIDAKSFIGTPFSSQPIYIAACAFLMESAFYSQPSSRSDSPPIQPHSGGLNADFAISSLQQRPKTPHRKSSAKHSLLAAAAKENYHRCYDALKLLDTYWAGIKYILTALDQKAKGIWDPLLFTAEEMEGTTEDAVDVGPVSGPPGWKLAGAQLDTSESLDQDEKQDSSEALRRQSLVTGGLGSSHSVDPAQAIGWSLTGDTNSSQPNLSFLYQLPATEPTSTASSKPTRVEPSPSQAYQSFPVQGQATPTTMDAYTPTQYQSPNSFSLPVHAGQNTMQPVSRYADIGSGSGTPAQTYSLGNASSMSNHSPHGTGSQRSVPQMTDNLGSSYNYHAHSTAGHHGGPDGRQLTSNPTGYSNSGPTGESLTIQSQDVDMSSLQYENNFPLTFDGEFMPWLEYLPQDVLNYFGEQQGYRPVMNPDDGEVDKSTMPGEPR